MRLDWVYSKVGHVHIHKCPRPPDQSWCARPAWGMQLRGVTLYQPTLCSVIFSLLGFTAHIILLSSKSGMSFMRWGIFVRNSMPNNCLWSMYISPQKYHQEMVWWPQKNSDCCWIYLILYLIRWFNSFLNMNMKSLMENHIQGVVDRRYGMVFN